MRLVNAGRETTWRSSLAPAQRRLSPCPANPASHSGQFAVRHVRPGIPVTASMPVLVLVAQGTCRAVSQADGAAAGGLPESLFHHCSECVTSEWATLRAPSSTSAVAKGTPGRRLILLFAGTTYLSVGRIDEAASHAREALTLTRRLGARGAEGHALCLAGDVASAGGGGDAESSYREALALAAEFGMRPLVAHCHLG